MNMACPDCNGSCVQVVVCSECHGDGTVPDDTCPMCGHDWENGPYERDAECEHCDGEGVEEVECWLCDGFGEIEAEIEDIKHAG